MPVTVGAPVTVVEAVSHTDHRDTSGEVTRGGSIGAPMMPTVGPFGHLAISSAFTNVGASGDPAISWAETKFNAGCSRPSTTAYNVPVLRSATIFVESVICPAGRKKPDDDPADYQNGGHHGRQHQQNPLPADRVDLHAHRSAKQREPEPPPQKKVPADLSARRQVQTQPATHRRLLPGCRTQRCACLIRPRRP